MAFLTGPTSIILATIPIICSVTWILTSLRYHYLVSSNKHTRISTNRPVPPPVLPYALPWLGLSLSLFTSNKSGRFWRWIQVKEAISNISVVTVLLGGRTIHIFSCQEDVQSLVTSKTVARGHFIDRILENSFGLPKTAESDMYRIRKGAGIEDIPEYFRLEKESNHKNLLSTKAVNTLTSRFVEALKTRLNNEDIDDWKEVDFFDWFRSIMLSASVTALFGSRLQNFVTDFESTYWEFDAGFSLLGFGAPRWMVPRAHAARGRLLSGLVGWMSTGLDSHSREREDSKDCEWHPYFGAKHVRERHDIGAKLGASVRALASLDLGLMFG